MRVLMLSQMYPRREAPTFAAFIHRQAKALVAAGIDVTLVSPIQYAPAPLWFHARWRRLSQVTVCESYEGVMVHRPRYLSLPGMKFHFIEGHTLRIGLRAFLERLHRETPFDLIHANRLFPEAFAALPVSRWLGIPLLAMARGMDVNLIPGWGPQYRLALRATIREVDGILAVSRALLEDLLTLATPRRPGRVVYNGVDAGGIPQPAERQRTRSEFGWSPESKLAIYVGRLEPDKGTPELLRAMGAVMRLRPDVELVCVGAICRPGYRTDVAQVEWGRRIHFLGERPHEVVQKIMRAGDFFVFPSRLEGVPNAVLEAMGNALPVVATRAGGIGEVVPEAAGILVEPGDVRGLAAAVQKMVESEPARERMGREAWNHVRGQFSWEASARDLVDAYADALRWSSL